MIPALQNILAGVDVKALDDLLTTVAPHDEPAENSKTVKLCGLLMSRNGAFIGIQSGDMIIKVPCNAVGSAKLDSAPPASVPKYGKYVILEIIEQAELVIFTKCNARDMGDRHGMLPFVLSSPSSAKDYAAAADAVDAKNKARAAKLDQKWTPIPFTPIEPIYDPNKSSLPAWDDSYPYNVNSAYDTKESKSLNSPVETHQVREGVSHDVTDYKIDESVDTSSDSNSDVKIAKGSIYSASTAYDTKETSSTTTPYDTMQYQNGQAIKITDYNDDYDTKTSTDHNSDLLSSESKQDEA